LIPNPIHKVLSSMHAHRVKALLMGGQACVFYGAAEFSRDTDFAISTEPSNLARLRRALDGLQAEVIAVPPFELKHLRRGHAIHFRCHHPEAAGLRIDVMSKLRGVAPFAKLWSRRISLELSNGVLCDLLSLPDLVQAKKTQRDKDWPMLRRLVEGHYFQHRQAPTPNQIRFWFRELRTGALLIELAQNHAKACRREIQRRPLLKYALVPNENALDRALEKEEQRDRERDRQYWLPLRRELEKLRHQRFTK